MDWSNLSLSLSLPRSFSAHHLCLPLPLLLGPLSTVPGSVTTGLLPTFWARTKENGSDRDPLHPDPLSKRPCTLSPAQRYSPSNGLPHPTPPHYRLEDMALAHHSRDPYRHPDPRELRERHRQLSEQCSGGGGGTRVPVSGSTCAPVHLCGGGGIQEPLCARVCPGRTWEMGIEKEFERGTGTRAQRASPPWLATPRSL